MAIPGLRRLDHLGVTVPDLEEATTLFADVLGRAYLYPLGPYGSDDDWMTVHLGVDRTATIPELRFFRCGDQAVLDVFPYVAPEQRTQVPRNSDVGGHHIALYVDDLDEAIEYLVGKGITMMGEPTVSSGLHEGQRWVYFRAPWGLQLELVSYPRGKAFQNSGQEPVRRAVPAGEPT
jgi:glyoxylase I family protein